MAIAEPASRLDFAELEQAVRAANPAVLFIEPRILRRVIKQDRRLAGIGFQVPHAHVYTIERERLLVIADRPELDLSPAAELPKYVILLPRPQDNDEVIELSRDESLHWYWRQLFHAEVHISLEEQIADRTLDESVARDRIRQIGTTEFAEIRYVLVKDDLLPPVHNDLDAYVEFLALSLELKHFAPTERPFYFPAIRDWPAVDALAFRDVAHLALYRRTRPEGAPEYLEPLSDDPDELNNAAETVDPVIDLTSSPRFIRLQAQADRAAKLGNHVRSAILRVRAAKLAYPERARDARSGAQDEIHQLALRLQAMWDLSADEVDEWTQALIPLLEPASVGFRRGEARLLYDLQKACLTHERGLYRFGWWRWIRSRGREPLRRPLPLLQQVLVAKSLHTAAGRLPTVRLDVAARRRLEALLERVSERMESRLRDDIRPRIVAVLDDVGLVPQNIPERVARVKLVEELLDRIVERGYISFGDLRDALSQNDLKLSDLSGPGELIRGDRLLRADRQLASALEGVYRPGTVYLRLPQRLSSLGFGTRIGRWLTEYIVLPFGGAYVALAAVRHVYHELTGHPTPSAGAPGLTETSLLENAAATDPTLTSEPVPWSFFAVVFMVGMLLMLLLHRPRFRAEVGRWLTRSGRFLKRIIIEVPAEVIRAPWMQRILQSQTWAVLRNYAFRPAIATVLIYAVSLLADVVWTRDLAIQVFLAADLFLNTPVGRYADEWLTDVLVRAWHELRIRVFAALFHWVMDAFHQLLQWLERVIYTVDEWLRFRTGDPRAFVLVKLLLSTVWGVIAYVVRICVTLLIEPQVNPIKHFPVVTVSHKILIPYTFHLSDILRPIVERISGPAAAPSLSMTLATTTILLLPGVVGFLVWELKGNWRLYAANRPRSLSPIQVGRHGETVAALMRPGIHSGTLPKYFTKLRHALHDVRRTEHGRAARRQLAALQSVEVAVRRFVDRTLCQFLDSTGFAAGVPFAGDVRLAINRIEFELRRPHARESAWLRFDDLSGWLTAEVRHAGWINELSPHDREHFNAVLAGFYKLAGVDLVREQLAATFGPDSRRTGLVRDALVVWDDAAPDSSAVYRLRTSSPRLSPLHAHPPLAHRWPTIERQAVVFSDRPIEWDNWVNAWSEDGIVASSQSFPPVLPPLRPVAHVQPA